jgi:hypothetical protein
MTAALEHLNSHTMSPTAKIPDGLPIPPTMQTIVVDCVPIVDPQLAPVIGDDAESVLAGFADS